jgi:hypothetical protein
MPKLGSKEPLCDRANPQPGQLPPGCAFQRAAPMPCRNAPRKADDRHIGQVDGVLKTVDKQPLEEYASATA